MVGGAKEHARTTVSLKASSAKKAIVNRSEWRTPIAPQQMRAHSIWWQPCCNPLGTCTNAYLHSGRRFAEHHSHSSLSTTRIIWNSESSDACILIATLDISVYKNENSESFFVTMQGSTGKAPVQIRRAPSTSHHFSQQQRGHDTPLMDQKKECIASTLATSKKQQLIGSDSAAVIHMFSCTQAMCLNLTCLMA